MSSVSLSGVARRLALSISPWSQESLRSYVERLAAHNRIATRDALAATGLLAPNGRPNSGLGLTMDDRRREHLAAVCGLGDTEVRDMLLARYDGTCLQLRSCLAAEPVGDSPRVDGMRQWMYVVGSHACPRCLDEREGAWKLSWKLPWSFACTTHDALLRADCIACGQRLHGGDGRRRTLPLVLSRVPTPGHCMSNHPEAQPGQKRLCERDLRRAPTSGLAEFPALIAAQRALEADLEARASQDVLERFRVRRSLCALLLAAASREQLSEQLPSTCEQAWRRHVALRSERPRRRSSGRDGPRARTWTLTPQDPALMATLLPTVLAVEDDIERFDALAPGLLDGLHQRGLDVDTVTAWTKVPAPHARVLSDLRRAQMRRFTPRSPAAGITLEARHVPRVLPARLHVGLSKIIAGALSDEFARSIAAVATYKHAHAAIWAQCAHALVLDPEAVVNWANHLATKLPDGDQRTAWWSEIAAATQTLASEQTDYRTRAARLADLRAIPIEYWQTLTDGLDLAPGKHDARRRNAAAHVWREVAGRPLWEAPAFNGDASSSEREVWRRFSRWLPKELERRLEAWGAAMTDPVGSPTWR